MQTLSPAVLLILVALGGLLLGAVAVYLASRRWRADSHAQGRSSRDADIATLTEQRDGALDRVGGLAARIDRYEREWGIAEQNLRKVTAHAAAQQAQVERFEHELTDVRRHRDDAQTRLVDLTRQHAALEAGAQAQAQAAAEKLQLLEQAEQRLREAFQNLANQILEDKAERFREQSVLQVGGLLDPLKLQLKEFRDTVTQTHASEQRERGMLAQEIHTLKQLNTRISEDAINLTRALKGDTRSQGAWGEMVLERVLEASGLQSGREYTTQTSFSDAEGSRQRPVRADDRLYTHALSKNISLVSPSTLLATLRTVAHLWRIERRNVNAVEIARRAGLLHDNFVLLVGELENIGVQLDKARGAQSSALRRLTEGGKGSVLLQVQSLAEMGAPVKKALPAGLLGTAGAGADEDVEQDAVANLGDGGDSA